MTQRDQGRGSSVPDRTPGQEGYVTAGRFWRNNIQLLGSILLYLYESFRDSVTFCLQPLE